MNQERGLVRLATLRYGRQVWRICLDEDPTEGQVARDLPERLGILEGNDPRERNHKAKFYCFFSKLSPSAEAMDDSSESSLARLLLKNRGCLGIRISCMNDQWQTTDPSGFGMGSEHQRLPVPWTVVVVEIETGLADPDHPRMLCKVDERCGRGVRLGGGLVGVNADGAPDIGLGLRNRPHLRKLRDLGADGHHCPDTGPTGARNGGLALRPLGQIVEMTMTVDEDHAFSAST